MKNTQLIHFTNTYDNLQSILKGRNLKLNYCKEVFYLGTKKISSAAHPMVCFSRFSESEIIKKTITYGLYGVALSENWGKLKAIHPVLYIDRDSLVANALAELLKARQNQDIRLPKHLRLPVITIKCFTKNAYGYNSYLKETEFDFRSENEWRYVPQKKDIDQGLISQNLSTYLRQKDSHNKKLENFPLRFEEADIKCIYVENERQVADLTKEFTVYRNRIKVAPWRIS